MWIDFRDLEEQIPILDLMKHYGIELKRQGKSYRGPCPLHNNGKWGQFSVLRHSAPPS